jgi:hypothetical protein
MLLLLGGAILWGWRWGWGWGWGRRPCLGPPGATPCLAHCPIVIPLARTFSSGTVDGGVKGGGQEVVLPPREVGYGEPQEVAQEVELLLLQGDAVRQGVIRNGHLNGAGRGRPGRRLGVYGSAIGGRGNVKASGYGSTSPGAHVSVAYEQLRGVCRARGAEGRQREAKVKSSLKLQQQKQWNSTRVEPSPASSSHWGGRAPETRTGWEIWL